MFRRVRRTIRNRRGSAAEKAAARPTIVYVNDQGALGGAELSCLADVERHRQLRHDVVLICPPASELARRARNIGVRVREVAFAPVLGSTSVRTRTLAALSLLAAIARLRRWLSVDRPAIVCGNSAKSVILAGVASRLVRYRPTVVAINYEDFYLGPFFAKGLYRRLLRFGVLTLSDFVVVHTRQRFAALCTYLGQRRAIFGRMPFQLTAFTDAKPALLRDELRLPARSVLIGMIAQLVPWKGQREFILAAADLLQRHANVRFVIVGDSAIAQDAAYREGLHQLCGRLGVTESVSFLGWRNDIPEVMAALDIFVLPSHHEPFGRVLVEAMAAGRPVVATASGGPTEIIKHGETGLLVPVGKPERLAEALEALVSEPNLRAAIGACAQAWIRDDFGLDTPHELSMAGICARLLASPGA